MPQKSRSKKATQPNANTSPGKDIAENAQRNFTDAMRSGQKLQQEAGQWWTRVWSQTANAAEWQKQVAGFSRVTSEAMPLFHQRLEEIMEFMGRSSRLSAELMNKAANVLQSPGIADGQAKWMDLWTASMKALQNNVESATTLSNNAIDAWLAFVRRNTEVAEIRVPKPA